MELCQGLIISCGEVIKKFHSEMGFEFTHSEL